jgi:PAS domain S-box-containing protein
VRWHDVALVGHAPSIASDPRATELLELAAIVESTDDAIISKDLVGTIRSWNRGAERLYGYTREEAIGQPISMLAPPDRVDEIPMIVEQIKRGKRVEHLETIRRRKDGRDVYVSLTVSPVRNEDGRIIAASVIARDVTRRHEAELALRESDRRLRTALKEARLNHAAAEEAHHKAEVLARRLADIQAIVDVDLAHFSLEGLLHQLLAHIQAVLKSDATVILLLDEDRRFEKRVAVGLVDDLTVGIFATTGQSLIHRVVERHKPIILEDTSGLGGPDMKGGGVRSVVGVPLVARGQLIGTLCTGQVESRVFAREDVALLQVAADRAATAIGNARLYERERSVAETLQRSLLPKRLPSSPAAALGARYLPAVSGMEIGGDWYDAAELPDGKLALIVGDVVGHGVVAAGVMGQVRNALRAFAFDGHGPSSALERLNNVVHAVDEGDMTTLVYLVFDPTTRTARFTSAGHPPPLVVHPDGTATYLEGGRSLPLGVVPNASYPEAEAMLEPGSTLLLYTDGLVERRGAGIDAGLRRLVEAASTAQGGVEEFLSHLIAELLHREGRHDDVALVALRPAG